MRWRFFGWKWTLHCCIFRNNFISLHLHVNCIAEFVITTQNVTFYNRGVRLWHLKLFKITRIEATFTFSYKSSSKKLICTQCNKKIQVLAVITFIMCASLNFIIKGRLTSVVCVKIEELQLFHVRSVHWCVTYGKWFYYVYNVHAYLFRYIVADGIFENKSLNFTFLQVKKLRNR